MTKYRLIVGLMAFLLLVIAVEFALIYIFDVEATILQSLKYIVPAAVAACLLLIVLPARKAKKEE